MSRLFVDISGEAQNTPEQESPSTIPSGLPNLQLPTHNYVGNENNKGSKKQASTARKNTIAAQPQTIWRKYVATAQERNKQLVDKWRDNMNNLLLFATLFTAIVTAFFLDALAEFKNMSPPDPSSSILTVCSLWSLSITSSLAATTWAILCLEWCTCLKGGVEAEGYKEMTGTMHRRFEAMERWKMHFIVAAIPLFLHLSLFLFLAGLWLRLRDIDKQLGLIVEVPSLIIASSYVIVTLLPTFTDAPFSTSISEVIEPVVKGVKHTILLTRFIQPPPAITWIANSCRALFPSFQLPRIPRLQARRFTKPAKQFYKAVESYVIAAWKTVALFPLFPTFGSDPFNDVNKHRVVPSSLDRRIHLRALFWLMKTPLNGDEVKEILKEFVERGQIDEEPLDHSTTRLLVLSLPSILGRDGIAKEDQPIFDYCTGALAKEMERTFTSKGPNQGAILGRNMASERLMPHFNLTPQGDGSTPTTGSDADYWRRAIPALWFCPSKETVQSVFNKLDSTIHRITTPDLLRVVRGLHAAALACFDQLPLQDIPNFKLWGWRSTSSNPDLDVALSSFLRVLFASFYATLGKSDHPTTIPSLIVRCLEELDGERSESYSPKLHTALCFFAAVAWRSDPRVFEKGPSVADALLTSAESYTKNCSNHERRSDALTTRLYGITYGPKPWIPGQIGSLTRLRNLYTRRHESTNKQHLLTTLLDAYAATLEATLATDGYFTILVWLRSPDSGTARATDTNPLFTDDSFQFVYQYPNRRLPYLYSLAIALTYTAEERTQEFLTVADLFVTHQERDQTGTDAALDTNILVVAVLKFVVLNQPETMRPGPGEKLIEELKNIVIEGTEWRTHWKSIYLAASLAFLLSQLNPQRGAPQLLISKARNAFAQVDNEQVPSDWRRKKKGLRLCKLSSAVESLAKLRGETDGGVYEWSSQENVPCLARYNPPRTTLNPISRTGRLAAMFHAVVPHNDPEKDLKRTVQETPADLPSDIV